MLQSVCPIEYVTEVAENVFILGCTSEAISTTILPGQFVNIRISAGTEPLLRRPFSVYRTEGSTLEIIFNVVGKGTTSLQHKRRGETLDVLGPLGVPFSLSNADFETAILVGGGLGVAPLPLTTLALKRLRKNIVTILGARSKKQIVTTHLDNIHIATDDGSLGKKGNAVELLTDLLNAGSYTKPMVFGCGPTAMLRALASSTQSRSIPCEVSLEGPMGCGFGICQGCPVELVGPEKKYALMCKDGPTFNVSRIVI
ncbi:MAG: dihydroorotate dehydrogenase electron transfer subunit [Bacteroidota bacterium]